MAERLISLSTLLSDGRPPPRKTRFPAAGPALPDGIGYPQGFYERFHIDDSPFPSFLAQCQPLFVVCRRIRLLAGGRSHRKLVDPLIEES